MAVDLSDPRHPDFFPPGHTLLQKALNAHSKRDEIAKLLIERDANLDPAWTVQRAGGDGWTEWWLRPRDPADQRSAIRIGGLPTEELARLEANWRARMTEADAPR